MNFKETMRTKLLEAKKYKLKAQKSGDELKKNELEIRMLQIVIGLADSAFKITDTQEIKDDYFYKIVYKMIKDNKKTMKLCKNLEQKQLLDDENAFLRTLVPPRMEEEEILQFMEPYMKQIKSAQADNQAIGLIMGNLKAAKKQVDGAEVKEIILKLREEHLLKQSQEDINAGRLHDHEEVKKETLNP